MPSNVEQLRSIQTFKQLIPYLEQELNWPFPEGKGSYEFDDLTFEYSAEELGLEDEYAAKIKKIHQLRPFVTGQPWGIFFVEFDNKKLPIVVLRRILSHLVLKKRKSANPADKARWNAGDLLFISAFAEERTQQREIAFAHFHQDKDDQPTLRVLGWDGGDTPLKLESVAHLLKSRLCWPNNTSDHATWRKQWGAAFRYKIGQQVRTADMLAKELARVARNIHDAVLALMKVESSRGSLRRMHEAFKTALIHDLTKEGFADTYAQTITYGLLTAAISRTDRSAGAEGTFVLAEDIHNMVPITNPFLKEMLESFLKVGGRNTARHPGLDFDELGVQDVVQLLRSSDIDLPAVLEDFGNRSPGEDPVIHFYQDFLNYYNKELRIKRGVFYTPLPVVSYIVRSVHELLQTEFGLEDGLASTITWGEMAAKMPSLKIPEGTKPSEPFVVILDPATGTATFLVEVIDVVHKTMEKRWRKQGHMALEFQQLWNEYVPKHLLPRLHGYELMMAPYAIAHMKIGLKLHETGYRFGSEERVRVYLTNALEPASDDKRQQEFEEWVPALAHEAQTVNAVKRHQRFSVIIGNPPYSGHSQNNEIKWIVNLVKDFTRTEPSLQGPGQGKWLQDDYVKFLRLCQYLFSPMSLAILGMITNHRYLTNRTFKGMRCSWVADFPSTHILNLHGNAVIHEVSPLGYDENVFDIEQGVAIGIFLKKKTVKPHVSYADLWGNRTTPDRNGKYDYLLANSARTSAWDILNLESPDWLFSPSDGKVDGDLRSEFDGYLKMQALMPDALGPNGKPQSGLATMHDGFALSFSPKEVQEKVKQFLKTSSREEAKEVFGNLCNPEQWDYATAKRVLLSSTWRKKISRIWFSPFDVRYTIYDKAVAVHLRRRLSDHFFNHKNLGLVIGEAGQEISGEEWDAVSCVDGLLQLNYFRRNGSPTFPLYLYYDGLLIRKGIGKRHANLCPEQTKRIADMLKMQVEELTPEDIFFYVYAVFYSPAFRIRYAAFLKSDFPRLPLTANSSLFRALAHLGGELVALHLLESPKLDKPITEYLGGRALEVEKISWSKNTVWTDKAQSNGFKGVREAVWNFHIGGYQVCEKWLKDRKGRKLLKNDITHYQKIVVALSETIRLMKEIDEVIEKHGGWPGAFATTEGHTVTS